MGLLTVIHIIGAVLLIILVLIQDSKGAMGSSFGGGSSQSILGPTGAPNFLFKTTRWVVLAFAVTSILLSKFSAEKTGSVLDGATTAPVTAPAETAAPTATPEQAPAATEPAKQ